jgi:cullin 1
LAKKLAKRLLFDKNINIDHEQNILSKLKMKFGSELTLKMQGMLNDLAVSKEMQASFNNSNNNLQMVFGVTVLNPAVWPNYKYSDLKIPSKMARCVELFKEFYSVQHNNRKLTWIYSLGTCDIISKFDTKKIEMDSNHIPGSSVIVVQ